MNIGAAHEKKSDYPQAVKAYERAADRYSDQPAVASEAIFKAGLAYNKEAKTAEYDQSVAGQAIATFTDFMALYPEDTRVAEAQKLIAALKSEQARGSFQTAKFYEKNKKWDGALIYYNDVLVTDPDSPFAATARERIAELKKQPAHN
jgi:outer membrane protein assembly factor BamD